MRSKVAIVATRYVALALACWLAHVYLGRPVCRVVLPWTHVLSRKSLLEYCDVRNDFLTDWLLPATVVAVTMLGVRWLVWAYLKLDDVLLRLRVFTSVRNIAPVTTPTRPPAYVSERLERLRYEGLSPAEWSLTPAGDDYLNGWFGSYFPADWPADVVRKFGDYAGAFRQDQPSR